MPDPCLNIKDLEEEMERQGKLVRSGQKMAESLASSVESIVDKTGKGYCMLLPFLA